MSDEGHVSIEYNISDHNGYNVQNDSNYKSFDFNSESPKIYINNENNTFGKLNQYSGDSYNFNDRIFTKPKIDPFNSEVNNNFNGKYEGVSPSFLSSTSGAVGSYSGNVLYDIATKNNYDGLNSRDLARGVYNATMWEGIQTGGTYGIVYTFGAEAIIPAKIAWVALDFSSILKQELDYLHANNILTKENIQKAKWNATIMSASGAFASEIKFATSIGKSAGIASATATGTFVSRSLHDSYNYEPHEKGWMETIYVFKTEYMEYPIVYVVGGARDLVNDGIEYSGDVIEGTYYWLTNKKQPVAINNSELVQQAFIETIKNDPMLCFESNTGQKYCTFIDPKSEIGQNISRINDQKNVCPINGFEPNENVCLLDTSSLDTNTNSCPLITPSQDSTINTCPLITPSQDSTVNSCPLITPSQDSTVNSCPLTTSQDSAVNSSPMTTSQNSGANSCSLTTSQDSSPNSCPLIFPSQDSGGNSCPLTTPSQDSAGNSSPMISDQNGTENISSNDTSDQSNDLANSDDQLPVTADVDQDLRNTMNNGTDTPDATSVGNFPDLSNDGNLKTAEPVNTPNTTQVIANNLSTANSCLEGAIAIKNWSKMSSSERERFLLSFALRNFSSDYLTTEQLAIVRTLGFLINKDKIQPQDIVAIARIFPDVPAPFLSFMNYAIAIVNKDTNSAMQAWFGMVLDFVSVAYPQIAILRLVHATMSLVKELLTTRKIIDIDGIKAQYTHKTSLRGFFKKHHKVSFDNDFFQIHVSGNGRNKAEIKADLEAKFRREAFYKVYQVLGVPSQTLDPNFKAPEGRFESMIWGQYMKALYSNWLKVNGKYLKPEERKKFEDNLVPESIKEQRLFLASHGYESSWFSNHSSENPIQFARSIGNEISGCGFFEGMSKFFSLFTPTKVEGHKTTDLRVGPKLIRFSPDNKELIRDENFRAGPKIVRYSPDTSKLNTVDQFYKKTLVKHIQDSSGIKDVKKVFNHEKSKILNRLRRPGIHKPGGRIKPNFPPGINKPGSRGKPDFPPGIYKPGGRGKPNFPPGIYKPGGRGKPNFPPGIDKPVKKDKGIKKFFKNVEKAVKKTVKETVVKPVKRVEKIVKKTVKETIVKPVKRVERVVKKVKDKIKKGFGKVKKHLKKPKPEPKSEDQETLERIRDKRSKEENDQLDNFNDEQTNRYNSRTGEYSRLGFLGLVNQELVYKHISVGYLFDTASTTFFSNVGTSLAYVDKEVQMLYYQPVTYICYKSEQLAYGFSCSFISNSITEHLLTLPAIMCDENLITDQMLQNLAPVANIGVGCGVVAALGFFRGKEQKEILSDVVNTGINTTLTTGTMALAEGTAIMQSLNEVSKKFSVSILTKFGILVPQSALSVVVISFGFSILQRTTVDIVKKVDELTKPDPVTVAFTSMATQHKPTDIFQDRQENDVFFSNNMADPFFTGFYDPYSPFKTQPTEVFSF